MQKAMIAIGALLAASMLVPDDASARPGGGGFGRGGGGFRGGMGTFRGGTGGFRGGTIGHAGGFRGAAVGVRPGTGHGFHAGWRGHGFRPGIRRVGVHHGGWWRYGHRQHYAKYYPYYAYGALATGLVGASYYYNDYPSYYGAAYPYYGTYPYYGDTYGESCYLHIRRLVGRKGLVVVRRQYVCS
jgi:hypothetical protein